MFNAFFGVNEIADELLSMLNLTKDDFCRFRDCYFSKDGQSIIVYTRLGGGNRPDYVEVYKTMKAHPNYIKDYDDDFDETYASFEFSIPSEFKDKASSLFKESDTRTGEEKFQELFKAMDSDFDKALEDNPRVKKVTENLMEQFNNPDNKGATALYVNPDGSVEKKDL